MPALGGTRFPPLLTVEEGDVTHRLTYTGESERVFLFFKVYEIAHYADADGEPPFARSDVLSDGTAKAIVITFARKLGRDQIKDEFAKSLRKNAEPGWLDDAAESVEAFIAAIDRDAEKGDQMVFYWLDGGRLFAEFNGERAFAVSDVAFAKLIWAIWFGADPACDRAELLASFVPAVSL